MARSNDLVGAVSEVAIAVAEQVFPLLPVGAALEALGTLLKKPVHELTDEELDVHILKSLVAQRTNLN